MRTDNDKISAPPFGLVKDNFFWLTSKDFGGNLNRRPIHRIELCSGMIDHTAQVFPHELLDLNSITVRKRPDPRRRRQRSFNYCNDFDLATSRPRSRGNFFHCRIATEQPINRDQDFDFFSYLSSSEHATWMEPKALPTRPPAGSCPEMSEARLRCLPTLPHPI
jgi:hypothetical protein